MLSQKDEGNWYLLFCSIKVGLCTDLDQELASLLEGFDVRINQVLATHISSVSSLVFISFAAIETLPIRFNR